VGGRKTRIGGEEQKGMGVVQLLSLGNSTRGFLKELVCNRQQIGEAGSAEELAIIAKQLHVCQKAPPPSVLQPMGIISIKLGEVTDCTGLQSLRLTTK
jgi:hypothetical protein